MSYIIKSVALDAAEQLRPLFVAALQAALIDKSLAATVDQRTVAASLSLADWRRAYGPAQRTGLDAGGKPIYVVLSRGVEHYICAPVPCCTLVFSGPGGWE